MSTFPVLCNDQSSQKFKNIRTRFKPIRVMMSVCSCVSIYKDVVIYTGGKKSFNIFVSVKTNVKNVLKCVSLKHVSFQPGAALQS